MSELLTYGSVGGGGSNPAPYPAANAAGPCGFVENRPVIQPLSSRVAELTSEVIRQADF